MKRDTKALGKAMLAGLRASGDVVRIVLEGWASPDLQRRVAASTAQGLQTRVVYGVLPSPYVAVEAVLPDGSVTELARRDLE